MTLLGPLCAFLSSCTWAIGSTTYSRLSQNYSAFAVNFSRAIIALPCFVVLTFVLAGGWSEGLEAFAQIRAAHFGWFTLSMLASYGFADVLFLWSTGALGVPGALAIASCFPIWTALWGVFALGEKLGALQVLGLALTVGGVIVVILNGPKDSKPEAGVGGLSLRTGVILACITSVLWSVNNVVVAQAGRDLTTSAANVVRMIAALLLSGGLGQVFWLLTRKKNPSASGALAIPVSEVRRWYWAFGIEAVGGSFFYMYGLAHSSLALGATLTSLAPVLSVPVAWVMGLEKFSIFRTLGVSIVVLGLWLLVSGAA